MHQEKVMQQDWALMQVRVTVCRTHASAGHGDTQGCWFFSRDKCCSEQRRVRLSYFSLLRKTNCKHIRSRNTIQVSQSQIKWPVIARKWCKGALRTGTLYGSDAHFLLLIRKVGSFYWRCIGREHRHCHWLYASTRITVVHKSWSKKPK